MVIGGFVALKVANIRNGWFFECGMGKIPKGQQDFFVVRAGPLPSLAQSAARLVQGQVSEVVKNLGAPQRASRTEFPRHAWVFLSSIQFRNLSATSQGRSL